MTTRRTLSWTIPGTPADILRRCADPGLAHRRATCEPTLAAHVTHLSTDADDDAALVMEVTAGIPESWLPDRLVAHLPEPPKIIRREAWHLSQDGAARADLTMRLHAVPATRMSGRGRLTPAGDSSVLEYELELEVSIPMLGPKVESMLLDRICRGYEREAHVIATG